VITVRVELGARAYPIHVGRELIGRPELLAPHLGGDVMVVTNETVAPLYLDRVLAALGGRRAVHVVLPDGEQYKTLDVLATVFDALLEAGFGRDCTVAALGGGVVGDIAGFAAACYQRGVDLVQMPTTLLAQVDSSVGGKTGVNHRLGKNMIGAFHQPRVVVADTDTLATLPERELRAGLAEVIKYGLIRDPAFFAWIEAELERLLERDGQALAFAIERSCENKAAVVAADERERDARAILNLGHSFAHAIETGLGYGEWLHGEAVAAGLVMASELSARLGWLEPHALERVERVLERAGLPTRPPAELAPERLRALMDRDKKVAGGRLRLVLLRGLGDAVVTADFDHAALEATLRARAAGP